MTEKIITNKRFGESFDLKEWITPNTHMVQELALRLGLKDHHTPPKYKILKAWEYVVEKIEYPFLLGIIPCDAHTITHYFRKTKRNMMDFWYFSPETISDGVGDCEDCAILITSLLRTFMVETDAVCVIGKVLDENGDLRGYHAWAEARFILTNDINGSEFKWYVLEGTLDEISGWITRESAYEPGRTFTYEPMIRFNDKDIEIIEDIDFSYRFKKLKRISKLYI